MLPIFTVTGLPADRPDHCREFEFHHLGYGILDTFSRVHGRHTIKFGTDIRREALDILTPPNPTGSYGFTTTGTDRAGRRAATPWLRCCWGR